LSARSLVPRASSRTHLPLSCALALVLLATAGVRAQDLPLWEAGAGLAVVDFPNYRGADDRKIYALPIPYVIYRGDFLQVDRQRVRGLLVKSDRFELDMSVNGSIPVRASDTGARSGMPDLDPTLELGPSANFKLLRGSNYALELRVPVRGVIASDFRKIRDEGILAQPNLSLDIALPDAWRLGLLAGPLFANQRYHQYFYGVDPQYATPERRAYEAHGGYSGAQALTAVSKRFERFWFGAFVKYDELSGAAFEDSPLVRRKHGWAAGVGIAWVFARSSRTVAAKD
jgi:outer membrane protein